MFSCLEAYSLTHHPARLTHHKTYMQVLLRIGGSALSSGLGLEMGNGLDAASPQPKGVAYVLRLCNLAA